MYLCISGLIEHNRISKVDILGPSTYQGSIFQHKGNRIGMTKPILLQYQIQSSISHKQPLIPGNGAKNW
jgi:hypothetical protein